MKAILTISYSEGLLLESSEDASTLIGIISRGTPVKLNGYGENKTATVGGKEISLPQVELIYHDNIIFPAPIPVVPAPTPAVDPVLDPAVDRVLSQEGAL